VCEKFYAYATAEEALTYIRYYYNAIPVGFIVSEYSKDLVGYDVLVEWNREVAEKYDTYLITRVAMDYDKLIPKVDRPGDLVRFGRGQWDVVFYNRKGHISRSLPVEWRRWAKKVMAYWPWVGQELCVVPRFRERHLLLGLVDNGRRLVYGRSPSVAASSLFYFLLHAIRHLNFLKGRHNGK